MTKTKTKTKAAAAAVAQKVRTALDEGGPRLQCLECQDVIQSKHRHDFVRCRCGALAVDGGPEYLRVSAREGARHRRVVE